MTTGELVSRVRQSDRAAFDALCRRCLPSLLTYSGLLLKSEWAEDVVQDVLFDVWRMRERLDESGNIRGYLVRAVYNRSLNYLKKNSLVSRFLTDRKSEIRRLASEYVSPDDNPVIQAVFCNEDYKLIASAVEALSPRCREVFKLSFYNNLSNPEISKILGISIRSVENNKYLALKDIQLQLRASI